METTDLSRLHAHESWADLFALLAISLRLPTDELAAGVKSGAFEEDVRSLFEELHLSSCDVESESAAFEGEWSDLKNALRCSYTELFTHPDHPQVAITESRFCDEREKSRTPSTPFLNARALHAEQCYRKAGLKFSCDVSREPADHMAMELEFLAYAHTQCAAALARDNASEVELWEGRLQEFRPHLEIWVADFFSACGDSGCGAFYPWLGRWGAVAMNAYLAQ